MSMTRDDKIKCDECGRFIGVQDLVDGKALHHCVTPDSEFSDETFESLCSRCWSPSLPSTHRGTDTGGLYAAACGHPQKKKD